MLQMLFALILDIDFYRHDKDLSLNDIAGWLKMPLKKLKSKGFTKAKEGMAKRNKLVLSGKAFSFILCNLKKFS